MDRTWLDNNSSQRTDVAIAPDKALYSLEAFYDYAIREVGAMINDMFE